MKSTNNIGVNHEWGKLREAVVGSPIGKFPNQIPDFIKNYASKETLEILMANKGKLASEALPEIYNRGLAQVEKTIEILKNHNVIVHRVEALTEEENSYLANIMDGCFQHFARDPIVIIGNNVIETEPKLVIRRKERFGIRRALKDRLENSNARIVSMPINIGPIPEICLEGGDVVLIGRDIYVGHSGNATNLAGINWLRHFLAPEYKVHEVKISNNFLHLDCILCMPRPGLAMVCKEGFLEGLPEFLKGWDIIEVSVEDAEKKLACNGLILDKKTIIVASELPHIAEKLSKAGQEVITTPFDAIYLLGGAFRCWHHPLVRESKLE